MSVLYQIRNAMSTSRYLRKNKFKIVKMINQCEFDEGTRTLLERSLARTSKVVVYVLYSAYDIGITSDWFSCLAA